MSAAMAPQVARSFVVKGLDETRLSSSNAEKAGVVVEAARDALIDARQGLAGSSVQLISGVAEYDAWASIETLLNIALDYIEDVQERLVAIELASMSASAQLVGDGP